MKKSNVIYNVGHFLPAFIFLVFLVNSLPMAAQNSTFASKSSHYKIPDFAFPKELVANGDSLLAAFLHQGRDVEALREAMNICLAKSISESDDVLFQNISLLDSIAGITHGYTGKLAYLIEAQMLADNYLNNSYRYNDRTLPLENEWPQNPEEWSGEMFKIIIFSLVKQATESSSNYSDIPLSDIKLLITDIRDNDSLGLNLFEFINFKGEEILEHLFNFSGMNEIPFFPERRKTDLQHLISDKGESLLYEIIDKNSDGNSVVEALAKIKLLNFLPQFEREEKLKEWLPLLKGKEGEGILLFELCNNSDDKNKYYTDIKEWCDKYPKVYGAQNLFYLLSIIEKPEIEFRLPVTVLPHEEIPLDITVENISKGFLLVFKLTPQQYKDNDRFIKEKFNYKSSPTEVLEFTAEGEIPFRKEMQISIKGLEPGVYVVIPSLTPKLRSDWDGKGINSQITTMRVTDIAIEIVSNTGSKDSGRLYVVKGRDQLPVEGAQVRYYSHNDNKIVGKGITNSEGYITIPAGYYRFEASFNGNTATNDGGFSVYQHSDKENKRLNILPDLSVYHPGDTVSFAVVGWLQSGKGNKIIAGEKINVTLKDANYKDTGTVSLLLDDNGRATGSLVIPKGKLLGSFSLLAGFEGATSLSGSCRIQVEEYKMPSFFVTLSKSDSENDDKISFNGKVETYSGIPLADANVEFKVSYIPWRWGSMGLSGYFSENLTSDSKGEFVITLPLGNLKGTAFSRGLFRAEAEAVNSSGERVISPAVTFFLGTGDDIRPQIGSKIKIPEDSVSFNVPVYDMAGMPVIVPVTYTITNLNDSSISRHGEFMSPRLTLPATDLPSGKYELKFSSSAGTPDVVVQSVLWRDTDTLVPYPTPLWIPKSQYSYGAEETSVEVKFGSYWPDHLLCIISDGKNILSSKWIQSDGMKELEVGIPESDATLFVDVMGMHNFVTETGRIKIVPEKSLEFMVLKAESFRENISAGEQEDWKFRFSISDTVPTKAYAFAVMSDKALNSIEDFKWDLSFPRREIYNNVNFLGARTGNWYNYKVFKPEAPYPQYFNPIPGWQTYGYSFVPQYGLLTRNYRLYKTVQTAATRDLATTEEAYDDVSEESALSYASESTTGSSGLNLEGSNAETGQAELRPVEIPLAFFMPDLASDEDGLLSIKFKVPDYNTTWQLQVTGYNDHLLWANLTLDAVASKKVMVKSNLPQFLRTGDKASITAMIYNNSDSIIAVTGRFEVFDPYSGKTIAYENYPAHTLNPSAGREISVRFDVPDNTDLLGVRVFAEGDNHTDGEQGYIMVRPSSSPVTEAITFYLKQDQTKQVVTIPEIKDGTNLTLKYCDNPLWDILLSLPAISNNNGKSSLSLAENIFSESLAADIIQKNPKIYDGLTLILNSEDSTLSQSNLQKDRNLKIAALQETPWVNNAEAETARIRDLEKYLDLESTRILIDDKISMLSSLQNADGGWSWFEGMSSSSYITSEIISLLGNLNKNGILDDILRSQMAKAVKYCDKYFENKFSDNNKPHEWRQALDYLYNRRWSGIKLSRQMQKIEEECLDSVSSHWRLWNVDMKAKGALLLLENEKYKAEGMTIARSLTQFLDKNLTLQEQALVLNLFIEAGAEDDAINELCEKIYLRKETEDWGARGMNAGVVQALMQTSPKDITSMPAPEIYIGQTKIDLSSGQQLTGNYTVNIDIQDLQERKIYINRQEGVPAWGGVVMQYVAPIPDIRKTDTQHLSIEKHSYIIDSERNAKETSHYRVGDKVRVTLTVSVGKDMDYVVLSDSRAACLQPKDKVSGLTFVDGQPAYMEIKNDKTTFCFESLRAGKYVISYDCNAERAGDYSLGIAEIQSLYSPSQVAHSEGALITVTP